MITNDAQIESYLSALRTHLGPMTLAEREEIVREIAAHIRDSSEQTESSVAAVLARLGPPQHLAAQYRDGLLIRRASRSLSPILLLRGAARLATKGVSGIFVFFVGVIGYVMGAGFVLSALMKPILPENTGLWIRDGVVVSSGTVFPPPGPPAHEILGMWYLPIALIMGSLTLLFTMWLIRHALRLSSRWQLRLQLVSRPV